MEHFITTNIKKLQVEHQDYIFNLIKDKSTYSENSNGIFVKLSNIEEETLVKIYTFMKKIEKFDYEELNNERTDLLQKLNNVLSSNTIKENKIKSQSIKKKRIIKKSVDYEFSGIEYNLTDIENKMKEHLKETYPKNSIYEKINKNMRILSRKMKSYDKISRVGITENTQSYDKSITIDIDDIEDEPLDDELVDGLEDICNIETGEDEEEDEEDEKEKDEEDEKEKDEEDEEEYDDIDEEENDDERFEKMKSFLQQRGIKFNDTVDLECEDYI